MSSKKLKGAAAAMPAGVICGSMISTLITCGLAVVLTLLTMKGIISESTLGYCIMGTILCATVFGSFTAAVAVKRRWMLVCWLTGMIYYLTLLGITALFFGGRCEGSGISALVINAGSLITGTILVMNKRHQEKSYEKYRTR